MEDARSHVHEGQFLKTINEINEVSKRCRLFILQDSAVYTVSSKMRAGARPDHSITGHEEEAPATRATFLSSDDDVVRRIAAKLLVFRPPVRPCWHFMGQGLLCRSSCSEARKMPAAAAAVPST